MKALSFKFFWILAFSSICVACQSEKDPGPDNCEVMSYKDDVQPIIMANCAVTGCHDGTNGGDRNWTDFSKVQTNAHNIKRRTHNGEMPPGDRTITQEEINIIGCWVDQGALNN